MLHTVNKSPFEKTSLESCLRVAVDGSAIILIEDAVYAALDDTALAERVRGGLERLSIYVLAPDLEARGLVGEKLIEGIEPLDYGGFVDLAVAHETVHAWL